MFDLSKLLIIKLFSSRKRCAFCQQFASLVLVLFILFVLYLATQALPDWINSSDEKKNQKLFIVEYAQSSIETSSLETSSLEVSNPETENYFIDAKIKMDFTPVAIEALENGVPLTIAIELQVVEKNPFLGSHIFDSTIKESILYFEIRYHALTEIYSIKNNKSEQGYQFNTRKEALDLLGNINHAHLISSNKLDKNKHHQVSLRVFLDIWKLPDVMRPGASLSNDWHLRSQWFSWMLN
jgi:hypothetical protein